MRNESFEIKLLLNQNSEMFTKLQTYRRDNEQLTRKNQDLNLWVGNLSEVFASLSSAWQLITDCEESLYTLLKKRQDAASKAIIAKYVSHFKVFQEIVTNLGEKITNSGHSMAATLDVKTRIAAFVSNYQLFFGEFVEAYFKFNEEYKQWVVESAKHPDAQQFRGIANKGIENQQKIKQFQSFMLQSKDRYQVFEAYSQHQLLNGIIQKKNQEIDNLKALVEKQSRKIALMVDYNSDNITHIMQEDSIYECFCGGVQLQYFKKTLQDILRNPKIQSKRDKQENEFEHSRIRREDIEQLQAEKQALIERNAGLQNKLQKVKLQAKFTEQTVLNSHVYSLLRAQCKDLMDYTSQLLARLHKSHEHLEDIEKTRADEIEQLKRRYQGNNNVNKPSTSQHQKVENNSINSIEIFKNQLAQNVVQLRKEFWQLNQKFQAKEDALSKSKQLMKQLRKDNEQLNRKVHDLLQKQSRQQILQFRHQKFNQLQAGINDLLNRENNQSIGKLQVSWKSFVEYIKSRDKKIKDLQTQLRKRQKQLIQKQKFQQILKETLAETEGIFIINKEKLDLFQQFVSTAEKQLSILAEENYKTKIQHQQQKTLLTMRLRAQTDARGKLEQKVRLIDRITQQIVMMKKAEEELRNKWQQYQQQQQRKHDECVLQLKEKDLTIELLKRQIDEHMRTIERMNMEKEKTKAQVTRISLKLKHIEEKSESEILRIELEEYRRKVMCTCNGERERQVVLKTCPHIFCRKCIDDTTANRNRKCPICGVKFTKTDVHEICWS